MIWAYLRSGAYAGVGSSTTAYFEYGLTTSYGTTTTPTSIGTTAELWVNLQAAHDLSLAKARQGKEIAREVNPRAA